MMRYITNHPYLFSQLVTVSVLLPFIVFVRPLQFRSSVLVSGLACIPCALYAPLHATYWHPARILHAAIGIEDIVFSWTVGALSWLTAGWFFRHQIIMQFDWKKVILRWGLLGSAGAVIFVAFHLLGLPVMAGMLTASLMLILIILPLRFELWPLSLSALLLFTPIYIAIVIMHFAVWPDYAAYWNPSGIWGGVRIGGVPLGEYVWAASFSAAWPLLVAYVFNVELPSRRKIRANV